MGRGFVHALAKQSASVVIHHWKESSAQDVEETARLVQSVGSKSHIVS